MPRKKSRSSKSGRRVFTTEFKQEAVQMLLDGHVASSVADRLGLSGTNLLYRWKREQLAESGPVASALEVRVHELETELCRVEQERDVLKKGSSPESVGKDDGFGDVRFRTSSGRIYRIGANPEEEGGR